MMGGSRSDRGVTRRQGEGASSPRPRRWLAAAGYGGLALACLALGALAFVLVAPPLDRVRDRLTDEVKARTGRTLVVGGPMSATLLPRVVVSLRDVELLPPEGMAHEPTDARTVRVPALDAEMSLWSLLTRRPKLDRLTLHRPTVELAVDAEGRRSWDIAPRAERPRASEPASSSTPEGPGPLKSIEGVAARTSRPRRPWAMRVVDATVRYRDHRSGTHQEIVGLNLDLETAGRGTPGNVNATFAWHGETQGETQGGTWRLSGTLSPELLEGRPGLLAVKLAGPPLEAAYEGTVSVRGGLAADGTLSLGRFAYKGLSIGPSRLVVSVDAGVAKATLQQLELYGGAGQGSLTMDTTAQTPAFAASLKLSNVTLMPLLRDAAAIGWIDGRGIVDLALTARGRSEQQIVETLHGKVQASVAEGAVSGIDIDRSLRALQRGRLDRLAPRRDDRTPFSELSGTFDIADGVARSQDLKLVGTSVQLSGEGSIELAPRRLDLTLQTRIAGGPPDDGAALRIGTIELPVSIKGPLDRPEFTIKGHEGLTDTIRQIGRNLRSREVQDAIKGLLGGDSEKRVKPGELIEKLLKKE